MIKILNSVISALGLALQAVLALLPDSPFHFSQNINSGFLGFISWIFPVEAAVAHLSSFCVAAAVYYGLRVILRWVKASAD